jgi:tRNA-dihydrouridine synthase A
LPAREAIIERMQRYAARELEKGGRLAPIVRHMLGLYAGQPGAREFRRTLSEGARSMDAGAELLQRALPTAARVPA